jgi:hypothetical protein
MPPYLYESVRISKLPLTARLLRRRKMLGPEFSPFVFHNMRAPARPRNDIRHGWAKALQDAGLDYFWIYNLRHTFASRLSAAGDLFVAQMIEPRRDIAGSAAAIPARLINVRRLKFVIVCSSSRCPPWILIRLGY